MVGIVLFFLVLLAPELIALWIIYLFFSELTRK